MDAILETGHGVRRVRDFQTACKILTTEDQDIAMAIVDAKEKGVSLLRFLNAFGPGFPILIVTDNEKALLRDKLISEIAVNHLVKPVDVATLRAKIQELCRQGEEFLEHHPRHTIRELVPA
jgi:DNA-binding response OmpR family regulator